MLEAEQVFNCKGKKQPKKISTAINTSVKMGKSHGILLAYASRKKTNQPIIKTYTTINQMNSYKFSCNFSWAGARYSLETSLVSIKDKPLTHLTPFSLRHCFVNVKL